MMVKNPQHRCSASTGAPQAPCSASSVLRQPCTASKRALPPARTAHIGLREPASRATCSAKSELGELLVREPHVLRATCSACSMVVLQPNREKDEHVRSRNCPALVESPRHARSSSLCASGIAPALVGLPPNLVLPLRRGIAPERRTAAGCCHGKRSAAGWCPGRPA